MFRSWLPEWRGGLTATALLLVLAVGFGLAHFYNPIALVISNLQMHAALALMVVAGLLLALGGRWRGVMFFLAGLAAVMTMVISLAPYSQMPTGGKPDLSLISFNLYGPNMKNGGRIADYLESSGADVVVAVESEPIVPFLDRLAKAYPYSAGCKQEDAKCGDVLILSKRRLDNVQLFRLGSETEHQAIRADIDVGDTKVHLFAVQLLRPEYGFFQVNEMARLNYAVENTNGPVIVAGDFNAATWLEPMLTMLRRSKLSRATIEPGTWPVMLGPLGVPIDHIFIRAPARFTAFDALADSFGSNHRGLKADISFGDAP